MRKEGVVALWSFLDRCAEVQDEDNGDEEEEDDMDLFYYR
jgi:hypothetical protein